MAKEKPRIAGPASAVFAVTVLWEDELRAAAKSLERFERACEACRLSPDSPPPTDAQEAEKQAALQQAFETCYLALHAVHNRDDAHLFVGTRSGVAKSAKAGGAA